MAHWAVTDSESGEHHFAISERSERPPGYDNEKFSLVRLQRAPCEHDRFDGRRLVRCTETQDAIGRCARFNAMTRAELVDAILSLVDERLALITATTTQEEI